MPESFYPEESFETRPEDAQHGAKAFLKRVLENEIAAEKQSASAEHSRHVISRKHTRHDSNTDDRADARRTGA